MKLLLRSALGAAAAFYLWQAGRGAWGAWYEYDQFDVARTRPAHPRDAANRGLRDIQFAGQATATIRGWYLPSRTGAAVVLAGGSESDRSAMWPYAALFADAGLGVVLFDWPGTGMSDGTVVMGEPERVALHNAVSFALAQPDVTRGRVGVLGFSLGSYIAALEASTDSRIRALVLEGLFDNPMRQTWVAYERAGKAIQLGGIAGNYLSGLRPNDPRAGALLPTLRVPLLLMVAGDSDRVIPFSLSQGLYARAPDPKQIWTIAGAGHGDYLTVDPTYGRRLTAALAQGLLAPIDTGEARTMPALRH